MRAARSSWALSVLVVAAGACHSAPTRASDLSAAQSACAAAQTRAAGYCKQHYPYPTGPVAPGSNSTYTPTSMSPVTTAAVAPVRLAGTLDAVGGPSPGSPRPVPGTVYITSSDTSTQVAVGADGQFTLALTPGLYIVRGRSPLYQDGALDCVAAHPVAVSFGRTATVEVDCIER